MGIGVGLDFPTAWGRVLPVRIFRRVFQVLVMVPLMRLIAGVVTQGRENLDGDGPFIYAPNHTSHLDTPLVLTALPASRRRRTVVAAAMDNFFMKRWVAFLTVLCVNGIPVDRHKVNRRSADQATRLLLAGWDLLIYPEGGRTTTGSLMEFKGGAAYLAEKVSGTVIPTFVHGAGNLQGPRYAKAEVFTQAPSRRRAPVSVTFGAPLRQAEGEHMRHFSARIEDAVAALGREVTGDVSYGRRD